MYELEKTVSKPASVIFYMLVVVIGAFFLVNLFLAVLFEAFAKQQEYEEAEEQEHEQVRRASVESTASSEGKDPLLPPAKAAPATAALHRTNSMGRVKVNSWSVFGERLVYVLIFFNTLSMCGNYYGESEEWMVMLYNLNAFFTCAFFLEMLIKLCGHGPSHYFASGWNRFDFVVTWCSALDLVLEYYGHNTEVLRALRAGRVLRLLRLNRKMRRFEETFEKVAFLVINLTGILVLFMVMFAMLGMELFGAKLGSPPPRTHFDDFPSAFVTVFCISSGEDWNAVFALALQQGISWG